MRTLGTLLLASCLALIAGLSNAANNTVATCPSATPGAVWGANTWLPCSAVVYASVPVAATAVVADMHGSVFSWMLASNVLAADEVWAENSTVTAGSWLTAVPPNFSFTPSGPVTPPVANGSQAVVSWTAPANFTDGTPVNVPLTYNVYRGTSAAALTKLTNVTGLTYTDPAGSATPITYFYAITATCPTCTESAQSNVVSKTIAAPALQAGAPAATIK